MSSEPMREGRVVVLSENHRRAEFVLRQQEPPVNPRGRNVLIITDAARGLEKVRGMRFNEAEGDRLIWESGPVGPYELQQELIATLNRQGFPPR